MTHTEKGGKWRVSGREMRDDILVPLLKGPYNSEPVYVSLSLDHIKCDKCERPLNEYTYCFRSTLEVMDLISALETGRFLDLFFSYYYRRAASHSSTVSSTTCTATTSTSDPASAAGSPHSSSPLGNNKTKISTMSHESRDTPGLADFMRGVHVYFYNMAATEKKKLARYLITYPFTSLHYPHVSFAWNNSEQRCLTIRLHQHVYLYHIYDDKSCWADSLLLNISAHMMVMKRISWAHTSLIS